MTTTFIRYVESKRHSDSKGWTFIVHASLHTDEESYEGRVHFIYDGDETEPELEPHKVQGELQNIPYEYIDMLKKWAGEAAFKRFQKVHKPKGK